MSHRLVTAQLDVDAEPFVGKSQVVNRLEVEACAELAERIAVHIVEISIIATGG